MGTELRVAGILLAAGGSSRMGRPKPYLDLCGRTFLEISLRSMTDAGLDPIVAVAGPDPERMAQEVARIGLGHVAVIVNPDWEVGQVTSLRAALRHLVDLETRSAIGARAIAGTLIHLVDRPAVRAETFRALVAAFRASDRPIAVATTDGGRGHPLIFARSLFAELEAATVGKGAREVARRDPGRVLELDVNDPGIHRNVDTPEAYASLIADRRHTESVICRNNGAIPTNR